MWPGGTNGSQKEGGVSLVGGGDEEGEGGVVVGQGERGAAGAEGEIPS